MNTLKHPFMRVHLESALESLADLEYQSKVWLAPPDIERSDSFTLCISILFDDLDLEEASEDALVGDILFDCGEASCVKLLIRVINDLFDSVGLEATDEQYVHHPQWPNIVQAAGAALALMKMNDDR
jgi:hypothetical protein